MTDIFFHSHHGFFFLVGGLKVQPQVSVKQYIFYRLPSELILEPITGQLSHYAPLSHFAPRYATVFFKSFGKSNQTKKITPF